MTVQQIFNASLILQKLSSMKLPIKKAYAIYSLIKQINEYKNFFIQEEKKLVDKFNATIQENGRLVFQDAEDQIHFIEAHNQMYSQEFEEFKAVDLNFDDLSDETLSPQDIMALEGIINFIE